MIIDAHQHFWRIARGDYGWMTDQVAPIRRDILPADLEPLARTAGVTGTVLIQAAPTLEVLGDVTDAETEAAYELGATVSALAGESA